MNISTFLLIEAALIIGVITLLLLHKGDKIKYTLLEIQIKKNFLKRYLENSQKKKSIELEKISKNQGSGIEVDSLLGSWKLVSLWKKDIDEEDYV